MKSTGIKFLPVKHGTGLILFTSNISSYFTGNLIYQDLCIQKTESSILCIHVCLDWHFKGAVPNPCQTQRRQKDFITKETPSGPCFTPLPIPCTPPLLCSEEGYNVSQNTGLFTQNQAPYSQGVMTCENLPSLLMN